MADVDVICSCGGRRRMNEFAVGMPATCPDCGQGLDYSKVAPVDVQAPAAVAPVRFEAPQSSAEGYVAPGNEAPQGGKSACSRCGRRFRGEWDIHETASGPLCHICANLATERPTEAPVAAPIAPVSTIQLDPAARVFESAETPAPQSGRFHFDPQSPGFQRALWAAGIGVVVLAIVLFLTEGREPLPTTGDEAARQAADAALWKEHGVLLGAVMLLLNVASSWVWLYAGLHVADKLPYDSRQGNLLHVLGMGTVLGLAATVLGYVPMAGGWALLVLYFWIFLQYYDFGFREFFLLALVAVPVNWFMGWVSVAVVGIVVNLLA